ASSPHSTSQDWYGRPARRLPKQPKRLPRPVALAVLRHAVLTGRRLEPAAMGEVPARFMAQPVVTSDRARLVRMRAAQAPGLTREKLVRRAPVGRPITRLAPPAMAALE